MKFSIDDARNDQKLFDCLTIISKYIRDDQQKTPNKRFVFSSIMYIKNKYIKKDYSDMVLWRFFPAPKNKTIKELLTQSVFVTSKTEFQSWSANKEELFPYYSLDYGMFDRTSSGPELDQFAKDVVVEAEIKGEYILLDVVNDLVPFMLELIGEDKFTEAFRASKFSQIYSSITVHKEENEVFVNIKGKEVKVRQVLCSKREDIW